MRIPNQRQQVAAQPVRCSLPQSWARWRIQPGARVADRVMRSWRDNAKYRTKYRIKYLEGSVMPPNHLLPRPARPDCMQGVPHCSVLGQLH